MEITEVLSGLLRINAAARELDISYWSLRRLCLDGKISYHRIGKMMFVSRSEVERLIRESRVN